MNCILLSSAIPEKTADEISGLTGCRTFALPGYGVLPESVRRHPDMLVFSYGGGIVTDKEYYSENKTLFDEISEASGKRIVLSEKDLGGEYPYDVRFNAFEINGTLFGRLASLSDRISDLFDNKVNVNQGYAKCSTAILPDSALITADRGIANAAVSNGIDALCVSPGGIILPGYDTGFIGGASFSYGDTLYFFGDIGTHPDHAEILMFADKHNCAVKSLLKGELFDFGGAVII